MKFFPESRKKAIITAIALAVSLGGTIYLNFFRGKFSAPPPLDLRTPGAEGPGRAPEQVSSPASAGSSGILPYGAKLDTSILDSDKFKILKSAPPVNVSADELGKPDPFK